MKFQTRHSVVHIGCDHFYTDALPERQFTLQTGVSVKVIVVFSEFSLCMRSAADIADPHVVLWMPLTPNRESLAGPWPVIMYQPVPKEGSSSPVSVAKTTYY